MYTYIRDACIQTKAIIITIIIMIIIMYIYIYIDVYMYISPPVLGLGSTSEGGPPCTSSALQPINMSDFCRMKD